VPDAALMIAGVKNRARRLRKNARKS